MAVRVPGGVPGLVAEVHGVLGAGGGHPRVRGSCGVGSDADAGLRAGGAERRPNTRQQRAVGGAGRRPDGTAGAPRHPRPSRAVGGPGRGGPQASGRRPTGDA
ncbi:hypothetical protein B6E66_37345 [Streptomyces maremycinicus]|nr:hypothetical protein B6E66_37345 [Streptomyces sp. B9173]